MKTVKSIAAAFRVREVREARWVRWANAAAAAKKVNAANRDIAVRAVREANAVKGANAENAANPAREGATVIFANSSKNFAVTDTNDATVIAKTRDELNTDLGIGESTNENENADGKTKFLAAFFVWVLDFHFFVVKDCDRLASCCANFWKILLCRLCSLSGLLLVWDS